MFLQPFFKCNVRNIKTHNILDIIEISKSMELNKCIHLKYIYENIYLNVSIYEFSKFDGSKKIKV
jgi:hypothetical protein